MFSKGGYYVGNWQEYGIFEGAKTFKEILGVIESAVGTQLYPVVVTRPAKGMQIYEFDYHKYCVEVV